MKEFFTFIEALEDEAESELILMDFAGHTKFNSHYKLMCTWPGCRYQMLWTPQIEFRNDMKCYMRLVPYGTERVTHRHIFNDRNQKLTWKDLGYCN